MAHNKTSWNEPLITHVHSLRTAKDVLMDDIHSPVSTTVVEYSIFTPARVGVANIPSPTAMVVLREQQSSGLWAVANSKESRVRRWREVDSGRGNIFLQNSTENHNLRRQEII